MPPHRPSCLRRSVIAHTASAGPATRASTVFRQPTDFGFIYCVFMITRITRISTAAESDFQYATVVSRFSVALPYIVLVRTYVNGLVTACHTDIDPNGARHARCLEIPTNCCYNKSRFWPGPNRSHARAYVYKCHNHVDHTAILF